MKTIKISEEVWRQIQSKREATETEEDILREIFSIPRYTLEELNEMNLNKRKPNWLFIREKEYKVDNWVDVDINFVKWLLEEGLLKRRHIPIYDCSKTRNRYFINFEPSHSSSDQTAHWCDAYGYWIDCKYNSDKHVKNIISTLVQLKLSDPGIKISLV